MKNTSAWLAWCTLLFVSGAYAGESINWNHWELGAFEAAKAQNKIILVNVGMEGCAACARIEDLTYADSVKKVSGLFRATAQINLTPFWTPF